jgi:hypothetical protein
LSQNPERTYELYLPYHVDEALQEFFDRAERLARDDHFGPSLDRIYYTLRADPYLGKVEGEVEWKGRTYETRLFETNFLRVLYFIDEEEREVTIFTPIELMPGRRFDE